MTRAPEWTVPVVAVVAVLLVASTSVVGAGAIATPEPATVADATGVTSSEVAAVTANAPTAAGRLDCTNGTSEALLACGFNPGPTAIQIDRQRTAGGAVTVRAVNLSEGGFVAVHDVSYVDGEFTRSIRGVTRKLSPGLHRDVAVELDRPLAANRTLLAVAYRDDDGDGRYDFVATNGTDDRPYTNTYSAGVGNVTDEAGEVVGDYAAATLVEAPDLDGNGEPARNVDADVPLEDVDGNGVLDMWDVAVFLEAFDRPAVERRPALFDFTDDGRVDIFDVSALLDEV